MTEDEMKTKACHRTHSGETANTNGDGYFFPQPATCLGSYCMAFRNVNSSCYCADLKRDD